MSKLQQKSTIEAVQYTGDNKDEVINFTNNEAKLIRGGLHFLISTPEGDKVAIANDWIIKLEKNRFYIMRPYVFEAMFEIIKEEE